MLKTADHSNCPFSIAHNVFSLKPILILKKSSDLSRHFQSIHIQSKPDKKRHSALGLKGPRPVARHPLAQLFGAKKQQNRGDKVSSPAVSRSDSPSRSGDSGSLGPRADHQARWGSEE
jgi:hypothetical protein